MDEEQIEGKRIALEKDARKYESLKKGIRKESYSLKSNPTTEATVHLPGDADTSQEVHGTAEEEADDKKVSAVYDNSIMGKETYKKIQSEAEARKPEFMYDGISNKEHGNIRIMYLDFPCFSYISAVKYHEFLKKNIQNSLSLKSRSHMRFL